MTYVARESSPANFPPDPRTMSLGDVDGFPEKSDSGEAQLYSVS